MFELGLKAVSKLIKAGTTKIETMELRQSKVNDFEDARETLNSQPNCWTEVGAVGGKP